MFFWYKKRDFSGQSASSRILRHFVFGVLLLVIVGGIIFFFANKSQIIGIEELKELSVEEGSKYYTNGDYGATITVDGITASVFECESITEASKLFEQYRAEYPEDDADTTQNIDFGDMYCKYSASGSDGVLIAVRMNERVAAVTTDDISKEEEAKTIFEKIVK